MAPTLYIVVPCYNEQEVLEETTKRLRAKLKSMIDSSMVSENSRIMYVNDGSKDNTWPMIYEYHQKYTDVLGICLSRNRGHQNALLAGLLTAKDYADCVISMDADLQDDIDAMDKFIAEYNNGADIVYGVRDSRKTDSFFKRSTALMFYKFMSKLGVDMVYNHADYRLMSKRALEGLAEFKEVNLFLRGIIPMIGYKTAVVKYDRAKRFAGESKYPFKKMLSFAIDGITSCSVKPIRMIVTMGFLTAFISFLLLIWIFIGGLGGGTVKGWASTTVLICFFGGLELMSIGIVGEYVGKIYLETKARPRFILSEKLLDPEDKE